MNSDWPADSLILLVIFTLEKFQSEPMSTSLLRFTKIYGVGRNRTFSQSASTLGPKGKKPKKAGKGGGKSATVEPLKAETVRVM